MMKKNVLNKKVFLLSCCLLLSLILQGCALELDFLTPPPPLSLADVPTFSGEAYVVLENGQPTFTEEELTLGSFESYAPLDLLGRCGEAFALVGPETMPTEERGAIGQVKPSGWHTVRYDIVDGQYLYNRCHLIGYQLTGENANVENLITGTRYLNIEGMLPFETQVAEYVEETGNHVLYRVTPIFQELELLARGVVMEAYSIEDEGEGICFHVYAYNAQPGITIDYATGESWLNGVETEKLPVVDPSPTEDAEDPEIPTESNNTEYPTGNTSPFTYVLNTNSQRFHNSGCAGVATMSEKNKAYFTGSRDELLSMGYAPCGQCQP